LLFEGAGIGTGELVVTISQGTNILAQTSTWLDLHDIKDFYEQALATNVISGVPPSTLISQFKTIKTVATTTDETKQIIVFVHGINNTEFDYHSSTETIFKRLYWSGYRGRVAGFRWPCAYLPTDDSINPLEYLKAYNYNKGEFYGWKSANAFKNYLEYLTNRADLAGYTLNILAHSQGNTVAAEALSQGAPFDNYIITQGAIPAQSFDGNAPTLQKLLDVDAAKPTPSSAAQGGYNQCFTNISGNVVNFFNTNDYALVSGTYLTVQANWEENQRSLKPALTTASDGFVNYYYYSGTNSIRVHAVFSVYTTNVLADVAEIRSMVARSRTAAVGGQGGLSGAIDVGLDLREKFGFDRTRDEHSAQFTRPIQSVWRYYDEAILGFQIELNVAR
jgi:predicted esterase